MTTEEKSNLNALIVSVDQTIAKALPTLETAQVLYDLLAQIGHEVGDCQPIAHMLFDRDPQLASLWFHALAAYAPVLTYALLSQTGDGMTRALLGYATVNGATGIAREVSGVIERSERQGSGLYNVHLRAGVDIGEVFGIVNQANGGRPRVIFQTPQLIRVETYGRVGMPTPNHRDSDFSIVIRAGRTPVLRWMPDTGA